MSSSTPPKGSPPQLALMFAAPEPETDPEFTEPDTEWYPESEEPPSEPPPSDPPPAARPPASVEDLLVGMNPEQSEAIMHTTGPLSVRAGAGSGKTRVIIHRIAALVRSGVEPTRILAVTFSKNGQLEMERRGSKMGLGKVDFRTWHSLALEMIRKDDTPWQKWGQDEDKKEEEGDGLEIPSQQVTSKEQEEEEERVAKMLGRPAPITLLKKVVSKSEMDWQGVDIGTLKQYIGYCKAWMWGPESEEALGCAEIRFPKEGVHAVEAFRLYNEAIEKNQILTYDDMLLKAVQWLEQGDNAKRWGKHWDHLLQDEAQDASAVQIRMAHLLASEHRNYFVVGDPAQAIFSFRGSNPSFLMNFEKQWEGAKLTTMHRNYRCGSSIIKLANAIIRPSPHRLPAEIVAEGGWEGKVTHYAPASSSQESLMVADNLQNYVKAGSKYSDNVILYRMNSQSRSLEETLLARKIPYYVVGGTQFYARKEIKALLGYLRLATDVDVVSALRRCINCPNRFLGREFVVKILVHVPDFPTCKEIIAAIEKACKHKNVNQRQVEAASEFASLIGTIGGKIRFGEPPMSVLKYVCTKTSFESWLRREEGDDTSENSHVANVRELLQVAKRFPTVAEMLTFVAQVEEEAKGQAKSKVDRVLLMTLHRVKGLEHKHVHFVGASEKIIPHPKSLDEDEERRLFYVGVTRAAHTLDIYSPQMITTRNGVVETTPSTYLIQAALQECIDLDGTEVDPREWKQERDERQEEENRPAPGSGTKEEQLARLYAYIAKHGKG